MGTEEVGERLPFGSPDGDRTDFREAIDDVFVQFGHRRFKRGLGMARDDRRIRVIVGRKGAGKTLYLRRLQDAARQNNSVYADDWQASMFDSDSVLNIADWYPRSQRVEKWEAIWRVSILRSLVSHLRWAPELQAMDPAHELALIHDFAHLYPDFARAESIYVQVVDIMREHKTAASLEHYLSDRHWAGLEGLLSEILVDSKPVFFYLDALDEYFEHAPEQWLACQLGLFGTVMTFLKDPRALSSRLHIVIGVRDIVFSSRLASEHKLKYECTDYTRTLNWDRDAVSYFLDQKLGALDGAYLVDEEAVMPVQRWLGQSKVVNARGEEEDLRDYLLRHTRLIPRDVVEMGNRLCEVIDRAADYEQSSLGDEEIRRAVRRCGRKFGEESLMMVANHLTADAIPPGALADGYAAVFTGEGMGDVEHGKAMQEGLAASIGELLGSLKHNRVSRASLKAMEANARGMLGGESLLDTLWQHGLLGHIDGTVRTGEVVFYDAATEDDAMRLPRDRPGYALHPILIDTISRLRGIGDPVEQG